MKLHNLVASKPKKLDSYKIPVIKLSTENLDTELLKYRLHHIYIDKNNHIKRNVKVELESLSVILDKYIEPASKENFREYSRALPSIITKTFIAIMITLSNLLPI